jgi:hypothetical protein
MFICKIPKRNIFIFLSFVVTKKKHLVHDMKFLKIFTIFFFQVLYTAKEKVESKEKTRTDKDF